MFERYPSSSRLQDRQECGNSYYAAVVGISRMRVQEDVIRVQPGNWRDEDVYIALRDQDVILQPVEDAVILE